MSNGMPPPKVMTAIERNEEVLDAIKHRKGELYALRCSMFVATTKMHKEMFRAGIRESFEFAMTLSHCFGIDDKDMDEFISNCTSLSKAQEV